MELYELLNKIEDYQSLANFIHYLRSNISEESADWNNLSLEQFLEAMEAWLLDSKGHAPNFRSDTLNSETFRFVGMVLMAGKMYE